MQRLTNVLDLDLAKPEKTHGPHSVTRFPSRRELKLAIENSELSVREFLSLRECKLHVTLAHRNSLIGKVAPDSQLLFNDLEIIEFAKPCLQKIQNKALKAKLEAFIDTKQANLNASFWNAIIAGKEMQKFWRSTNHNQDYPQQLKQESVYDLDNLIKFVLRHQRQASSLSTDEQNVIENQLGQLRFGDGGQLVHEFAELDYFLEHANQLIRAAIERPLCLQAKPTTKAIYLSNVVNQFFINGVQLHSARLLRRQKQLMPSVHALESALGNVAPTTFRTWQDQRDKLLSNTKTVSDHAQLLQTLYQQCGLKIGSHEAS